MCVCVCMSFSTSVHMNVCLIVLFISIGNDTLWNVCMYVNIATVNMFLASIILTPFFSLSLPLILTFANVHTVIHQCLRIWPQLCYDNCWDFQFHIKIYVAYQIQASRRKYVRDYQLFDPYLGYILTQEVSSFSINVHYSVVLIVNLWKKTRRFYSETIERKKRRKYDLVGHRLRDKRKS